MPTPIKAWEARDGTLYASAEQAARRDLFVVLMEATNLSSDTATAAIDQLIKHADTVVSALTTGPTSRPGARKKAGTTSPRRAAKRATQAQVVAGIAAMRQAASEGGTNGTHDADVPAEAPAAN